MHVDNEARRRLNLQPQSTEIEELLRNIAAAFLTGVVIGVGLGLVYLSRVGAL